MSVLLSCEQGGQSIPPELSFREDLEIPAVCHDPASEVAGELSRLLRVPLIQNKHASSLIDVRLSSHHRDLFGKQTRKWKPDDRQRLLDTIYFPYREKVRSAISHQLSRQPYVVHLSVQTFGLRSKSGKIRRTDVGLSYDPSHDDEVDFCLDLIDEMYDAAPMLRVRRNYPRRGSSDSITKSMRSEFRNQPYIGIELMLNRAWSERKTALRAEAIRGITLAISQIVNITAVANAA
ncbi:N-formylglutamate amidohydrolase [Rubripirellula obstinata]|uniref:N-formylglutamate amidohydrolase n=1 Tax=Rubripirellula obstinata TaxID=406547 RepID=A0A5B1CC78_9BACT|nr:N-formylglutamate amidohydrolase [Rubripirellula obstinata]KAA1257841.1 N-formylglutamate amidohydrolase [Rubripirellula obstinata]